LPVPEMEPTKNSRSAFDEVNLASRK